MKRDSPACLGASVPRAPEWRPRKEDRLMSTPPISDIDQLLAENAALRARIADLERQCASRPAADAGVDLPDHTAPATVADMPLDDLLEQLFTHTPLALQ